MEVQSTNGDKMGKPKKGTSKDMRLKKNRKLKGMSKNDPRRKNYGSTKSDKS